jgi:hypothetical protein
MQGIITTTWRGQGCAALVSVALCALLAADAGAAAPRANPQARAADAGAPTEAADPAAWMNRIAGRYRFDGSILHRDIVDFSDASDAPPDPDEPDEGEVRGAYLYLPDWAQPVQGKGDCTGFSDGAGLQCVVNIAWPEQWRDNGKLPLGGASDMTPALVLAGLTPSTSPDGIRYLLVDKRGLAHPGALVVSGDTATVKPVCVNLPGTQRCEQVFRITAKAGADVLHAELSFTARYERDKRDRKKCLGYVKVKKDPCRKPLTPDELRDARTERPREWVEETLSVSFAMHREADAVAKPADVPADQGSR